MAAITHAGSHLGGTAEAALPTVVCCSCGVSMKPNQANTCAACLQSKYDISDEVAKNGVLLRCKGCLRFQKDSIGWLECDLESKELLALCLRKTKGLKQVKLVDACFIWTEPNSKRVKVKLKIQKEVVNGVILQETCVVEFVLQNFFCENCHASEANLTWNSVVQVRQKVVHKRTFLYLEQLIIKHKVYERTLKIEPEPFGVNFFFSARNDAVRFTDFLESVVPCKSKTAKKIISADVKANIATWNHTFSVDIVPICKDDVMCLPQSLSMRLGNISPLVICLNVSSTIRLIDPVTCQICELHNEKFWQKPFRSMCNARDLIEFTVLDVQPAEMNHESKHAKQKKIAQASIKKKRKRGSRRKAESSVTQGAKISTHHSLAWVEVARTCDLGVNDNRYTVLSHLGRILKPGDSAMGYDLATVVVNDSDIKDLGKNKELPDIVLVRKHYPMWRKAQKRRAWKLKSLVAQAPDAPGALVNATKEDFEQDHELFMRDIEEDMEVRNNVHVIKNEKNIEFLKAEKGDSKHVTFATEEIEEDAPVIGIESMMNDMTLDLSFGEKMLGEKKETSTSADDIDEDL